MRRNEHLRAWKEKLGLNYTEISMILGVDRVSVFNWVHDKRGMANEFYATVKRLDCENLDQLERKLHPKVRLEFNRGRMSPFWRDGRKRA